MKINALRKAFTLCLSFIFLFGLQLHSRAEEKKMNKKTESLSLKECIDIALKKNHSIKITGNNISISRLKKKEAYSQLIPKIEAGITYDRLSYLTTQKQRFLGNSYDDFKASVYINQPLFTGGSIASTIAISKKNIKQAVFKNRIQQITIAYDVKKAYYDLCYAGSLVDNNKEAFQYADSFYRRALVLRRRTKLPRYEVLLQIKVQRDSGYNEYKNAVTKYNIAQKKLLTIMGLPLDKKIDVKNISHNFKPLKYNKTIKAIINKNFLLKSAKLQKALLALDITKEKSNFWPRAYLRGGYTYEFSTLQGDHDWYLGLSVTMQLGSIYKTLTAIDILKKEKKNAELQLKLLHDQLRYQFKTALISYNTGLIRLKTAASNKESAKRSLLTYYKRYNSGTISNSELLEAQKVYAKVNNDYCTIVHEMRIASASLEYIKGIIYENK